MKRAKQRDPRAWMKQPAFVMFLHPAPDWCERMRAGIAKYAGSPVQTKGQSVQTNGVRLVESPPDFEAMTAAIESINLRKLAAQRMATWLANQIAVYGYGAISIGVDVGQEARITLDELLTPDLFLGKATRD